MIKKGLPRPRELVVVEIVKINPNSVFVKLKEYDADGMIHISEVSRGWVKDVRRFVKVGQETVARILKSNDGISLSLKRVTPDEKNTKIKNYRLEIRAEKLLELTASNIKASKKEHQKIIEEILDKYGTIYEAFKLAVSKPEKLKKHIDDKWYQAILETAQKNFAKKEFELKARLIISSSSPTGIEEIKQTLKKAEKMGFSVKYISAPEYLVKHKTKDPKKGIKEFEKVLQTLSSEHSGRYEIIED